MSPDDYVIILASDGLWDEFSSFEAIKFVQKQLLLPPTDSGEQQLTVDVDGKLSAVSDNDTSEVLNQAAKALAMAAYNRGSDDNISVILLKRNAV